MALIFPYRRVQLMRPGATVAGAMERYRPLVDLSVTGTLRTVARQVVIDPGADEIVLPERDAVHAGIDLSNAVVGTSQGVGSLPLSVRYATVFLRLSDGFEFRTWTAVVGFSPALRDRGLFGIAQGLQYFTATFDGKLESVSLEVNDLYPGT